MAVAGTEAGGVEELESCACPRLEDKATKWEYEKDF